MMVRAKGYKVFRGVVGADAVFVVDFNQNIPTTNSTNPRQFNQPSRCFSPVVPLSTRKAIMGDATVNGLTATMAQAKLRPLSPQSPHAFLGVLFCRHTDNHLANYSQRLK